MIMNYLDFLYYKYYISQVKIGNRDIAPFSAMLIIVFTVMLYYFDFFFLVIILIPKEQVVINPSYFMTISFLLFFSLIIVFYFLWLHKGKYKQILSSKEKEFSGKSSFSAVLFPIIGFLLFNLGWILKMLQNQANL